MGMFQHVVSAELPAEATSFVGRSGELTDVGRLLRKARLVTLTGPGGVGKTRIAVRAARAAADEMADGVCMLSLSALRDPELLPGTVATALGLPEQSTRPALGLVVDYLRDRQLLLVLDTCEHLLDACAQFADVVLSAADQVVMLATSRQPLDVPGENVCLVCPLPPDGADAVALFADRAAAVAPGFVLDDESRPLALKLCQRLDGIPLAIELAAVRLRALSLSDLVERLGDRFGLLTSGNRVGGRHQTLRTTIEWSRDLCLEPERLLWARLSVFAGEFDLVAAEAIGEAEDLPRAGVLDALSGLVDKSIVVRFGDRYRMLDTIREYGAEYLTTAGQCGRCRRAHRDYYLELARRFDAAFIGPDQMDWVKRITTELANFRVALDYCLSTPGEAETGLELAVRLWGFWISMNLLTEGRYWMGRALDQVPSPATDRVRAQWLSNWFLVLQGEPKDGSPLAPARAEAIALADEAGLAWVIEMAACTRGVRGDMDQVVADHVDALDRMKRLGDETGITIVGAKKGGFHALAGQFDDCVTECDEALRRLPEGECWIRAYTLWMKSIGLWYRGDYADFERAHHAGLRLKAPLNDLVGIAQNLEGLAWDAARLEDFARTARLQGAAERIWQQAAVEPRFGISALHVEHEKASAAAWEALGDSRAAAEFDAGIALTTTQAVGYALGVADAAAPMGSASPLDLLTAREREVSVLIADGLTNREIAARLVVSKRTVDAHVEHMLSKLGFSSRTQIAGLIARHEPSH